MASGTRWLSMIAVVFSGLGAVLMFVVGAVTVTGAVWGYLGAGDAPALSEEAGLTVSISLVSALDEFVLALVLLVFAYGVLRLFVVGDRSGSPSWLRIDSVTDLKVDLLQTIAILLAVLFLQGVLDLAAGDPIDWSTLVLPIAVGVFSVSVWLIKSSH